MAAQDAALEAVAESRFGDAAQAGGAGIVRLIDMEIDIQTVLRRQSEDPVQRRVQRGDHVGDAAQHAAMPGDEFGDAGAFVAQIGFRHHQRHGLKRDPAFPALAHLGEHRP